MTQRADVTYAVYSAENPASRPKIRKTPIRSWLPSVVRCRLMASLARVIAVEKPMQYSVPWTSLSIVFGMATSGTPGVDQDLRVRQRVVATDRHEDVDAERLDVVEDVRRQVVDPVVDRVAGTFVLVHPRRQPAGRHLARVRPRGVQDRPAGPFDGPRVDPVERAEVVLGGLVAGPQMGQPFPSAADAEGRVAGLRGAIDDALDDGIEAGHVAAAGEDRDPFRFGHAGVMLPLRPRGRTVAVGAQRGAERAAEAVC